MKMLILVILLITPMTFAKSKKTKVAKPINPDARLGSHFDFDDMIINGKYHYPDEARAVVEDEKALNDLLSFRKDYKDRLKKSGQMD